MPLSFSENVLIYSSSKSKILPNALGAISPSGNYYTVRRWLAHQAECSLPPLEGDLIYGFDNDQVIGRTYHVRADNKVRASVITSVCAFADNGTLQREDKLKPSNWKDKIPDQIGNITDPKSEVNAKASEVHYNALYKKLLERIDKVKAEQREGNNGLSDVIDHHVHQLAFEREWKLCGECSERNRRTKRVCEHCGARLTKVTSESDSEKESSTSRISRQSTSHESVTRVSFSADTADVATSSSHTSQQRPVTARDPIFVNPNSTGTIAAVLRQIGRDASVKQCSPNTRILDDENRLREWLQVVCDGLPYSIALNIINNFYKCRLCSEKVQGKEPFQQHMSDIHPNELYNLNENLEFGWVLLKIGHGHYEMNAASIHFCH